MKAHLLFFPPVFLVLLMIPYSTQAQQVNFKRVLLPEGSYYGLINGVSQDTSGYMWFATYAKGLHRYDGYHVVTFLNDPLDSGSLGSDNLEAVYACLLYTSD